MASTTQKGFMIVLLVSLALNVGFAIKLKSQHLTDFTVGMETRVAENEHVTITKAVHVSRKPGTFYLGQPQKAGDTCRMHPGDTLTVHKIRGEMLIVTYERLEKSGSSCPSGTQFEISKARFATMSERRKAISHSELLDLSLKRLLKDDVRGHERNGPHWWVTPVNLETILESNPSFNDYLAYLRDESRTRRSFGDCFVDTRDRVQERGADSSVTIYEVVSVRSDSTTACPVGTLYFKEGP